MNRNIFIFALLLLISVALDYVEAQHNHGGGGDATTATNKSKKKTNFTDAAILTNGTLFYIAISISFGLWSTGFGLDYIMDRHEKQEHLRACQKYTQAY